MNYFVTGSTGFIGRFLVERLLGRGGEVHVLVREASASKLDRLADQWGAMDRVHAVLGDLTADRLGVEDAWIAEHEGKIDHVFHLAAMYDMTASEEDNRAANVGGTRHAVELANAVEAGCLHHVSSVAAAGLYQGTFTEDMFDEGQPLDHPYHATKHESEGIAREETTVPWRVYRPAIVIGHSRTGEMDKIDGPYYFFNAIRLGARLPDLLPLLGPRLGETNVVPVDFVVDAMDHIAHLPNLDGRAFHLVNYEAQGATDVINAFCRAAGAPRLTEVLVMRPCRRRSRSPGSAETRSRAWACPARSSTTSPSPVASTPAVRRPRWPGRASYSDRSRNTPTCSGATGLSTSRRPADSLRAWLPPSLAPRRSRALGSTRR